MAEYMEVYVSKWLVPAFLESMTLDRVKDIKVREGCRDDSIIVIKEMGDVILKNMPYNELVDFLGKIFSGDDLRRSSISKKIEARGKRNSSFFSFTEKKYSQRIDIVV